MEQQTTFDDVQTKLQATFEEQLVKARRQGILIGTQAISRTVLEMIAEMNAKPGKVTFNDQKRCIESITNWCIKNQLKTIDPNTGEIVDGDES